MNPRTQTILVNASITAGLVLMFCRGYKVLPLVIAGVLLFAVANVLLAVKRRRSS
jgi:hypothetical protein